MMITKRDKGLLAICVLSLVCIPVSLFSKTPQGSGKIYEVHPEITLPQSKTDIDRVMDAYEHLLENYLKLTESNSKKIHGDINILSKKMDSLDRKISELSIQVKSIQEKLGVETVEIPDHPSTAPDVKKSESQK